MKGISNGYKQLLLGVGIGCAILGILYFIPKSKENQPQKESEDTTDQDQDSSIIIGDSQTPFIARQSKDVKMLGVVSGENVLWKGGVNLKWLKDSVSKYPTTKKIKNVVINIGTNGGFSANDDVKGLVSSIEKTFPNAKLYVVKGSWGWGGNKNVTEQKVNDYYDKFKQEGVDIINPAIGKVNDPHSNLPIYKEIGKSIDNRISN